LTSIKEISCVIADIHVDDRCGKSGGMMETDEAKNPAALAADKVSVLTNLVQPADGSVVSRVLARSKGGSVTLFAFDGGQGLSEHTAPFDALVQVVEGRLTLTIGGDDFSLGAGEINRMPANVPHALNAPEKVKMLLTMLREPKSEE
jgi:quercetin dioxygenase-like cupin family protein